MPGGVFCPSAMSPLPVPPRLTSRLVSTATSPNMSRGSGPPMAQIYPCPVVMFFTQQVSLTGGLSVRQPGAIFQLQGGRGGHPSMVPQYTKDHLKSIIFLPPDWLVNDTTQMILGIMVHRQRVTSSSLGWCPPPKNPNKLLQTSSEI